MKPFSLLQKLDSFLLGLAVFTLCGQIDVRHFGRDTIKEHLGYATKTYALSLSDVVFVALVLWFIARTAQLRAWNKLWWPPLPCWALLFALILSALHSPSIAAQMAAAHHLFTKESKGALADIVQWVGYFLVAPWVFVNLLRDRREGAEVRREGIVVGALVGAFVVSGLVALLQGMLWVEGAPSGLWSSPNIFGAVVAFTLPFLDEIEIRNPRFSLVPLGLSLFALGVVVLCVASPWAAGAALFGLGCATLARPNPLRLKATRLVLLLCVGVFVSVVWTRIPSLQPYRAEFATLDWTSITRPIETRPVKKQFVEWQVATRWNLPRERAFVTGVGPGNYQLGIGQLYQYGLDSPEKMHPDSNNLFLVQAMSIGILGLSALLWMLWHFGLLAWRAARTGSWMGAGIVGSMGAWMVVNSFHAMIVRGAGLLLALFFALAVVAASNNAGAEASKKAEL